MADSLSLDVRASCNWLFQDGLDLSTVSDASKLEYTAALADGTGDGQVDKMWHDERSLSSAQSEDLDLTGLDLTLFGSTVTIVLAKVKALLIVNTSTTAGDDLLVGGAGAGNDGWGAPFDGDQDAQVSVPADSVLMLMNKKDGWTVTGGSNDALRIENTSANTVTYRIAIIGTSS
jgi:hypothetical protein